MFTSPRVPHKKVVQEPPLPEEPKKTIQLVPSQAPVPGAVVQPIPPPVKVKPAKLRARLSTFGDGDINEGVGVGRGDLREKNLNQEVLASTISGEEPVIPSKAGTQSFNEPTSSPIDVSSVAQRIAEIDRKQDLIEGHCLGSASKAMRGGVGPRAASLRSNVAGGRPQTSGAGKRPNIIAMTKCFLDNIEGHADGNSLIDRDGDENVAPSFEEEKYISYEGKINWALQSSWKQHFEYRRLAQFSCQKDNAYVDFTLDKDGKLIDCTLLQSSGVQEVDAAIMENMRIASPFPPLPKHFNMQVYHTGRRISVYATPS